jgi:hypothetical protein
MVVLWLAAAFRPAFGQAFVSGCGLRGSVVDEKGTPVAGLFLTAYSIGIEQGHRTVAIAGSATTDVAGRYCVSNIRKPGKVFLRANEWFDFTHHRKLPAAWYPGVAEFGSAKPVDTVGGTQADFTLASVRTFTVDGRITGLSEFDRMDSHAETPEGIMVGGSDAVLDPEKAENGFSSTVDAERGTFALEGAARGDWTFVFDTVVHGSRFEARLRLALDRDIHDAVLAFGPAPERRIALNVNGRPFRASDETASRGFDLSLYQPAEDRGIAFGFPASDLQPGAYKMNVQTPFECVESFSPGDMQVAGGNLMIASGEYAQPISIAVGRHCAKLTIRLPERRSFEPMILLVPESLPFRPITVRAPAVDLPYYYYPWPLSPGTYRVYAFEALDGLEYENPAALSQYSGRTVTLEADKTSEMALDIVNRLH